ncbi:MAG: hypothetical protein JWR26_1146 [Pedosphaera sp.]|nr:hypothetical protein [Pedosphaera sp.]
MIKFIAKGVLTATCCFTLSGCLLSSQQTVYRDVDRTRVEFENETAARLFYEALSKTPPSSATQETTSEVCIPFVLDTKRRVIPGQNYAFNEAVKKCDTNQDGKITQLEATIFAENGHR